jgi:hypothetical protein
VAVCACADVVEVISSIVAWISLRGCDASRSGAGKCSGYGGMAALGHRREGSCQHSALVMEVRHNGGD